MKRLVTHVKGLTAVMFASALTFSFAGTASALPVSDFTSSSAAVGVGEPVVLTFTGSCDLEPCRIQWRWFEVGGSRLGATIGEGPEVTYAFDSEGVYFVVAKITNAGSTHGSSTSTQVITVGAADPPIVVEPPVVVDPPVVDPPPVGPPVVDPPVVTDPPVVDPPVVDPPVVDPPVTDPPVTDTPPIDPPATDPPNDNSGPGHSGRSEV